MCKVSMFVCWAGRVAGGGGGAGQGSLGIGSPELLQRLPRPKVILQHARNHSSRDTGGEFELMYKQGKCAMQAVVFLSLQYVYQRQG